MRQKFIVRAIRFAKGLLREEIAREKMVCSLANEHILLVSVKYGHQMTARLRKQHFKTHIKWRVFYNRAHIYCGSTPGVIINVTTTVYCETAISFKIHVATLFTKIIKLKNNTWSSWNEWLQLKAIKIKFTIVPFDCIHRNINPFLLQARKDFVTFFWSDNVIFFLTFFTEIHSKVKQMNWTKRHK